MLILALDSCGAACATGVWQDGVMIASAREDMARGQDARLMPMLMDVMAQAKCDFAALDKIAVTRGPGSFTGSRVGLAAARGIGLAANKSVIGIDRFAIYHAAHAAIGKDILVVIESKRAELFCKFFPAQNAPHEFCLWTEAQIADFIAAHPDVIIAGDRANGDEDIVKICADLAAHADAMHPDYQPRPLYLRAPDVSFPTAKASSAR